MSRSWFWFSMNVGQLVNITSHLLVFKSWERSYISVSVMPFLRFQSVLNFRAAVNISYLRLIVKMF